MFDEGSQKLDERENFRLTVNDRKVADAKCHLHRRQFIQIIQNDEALLAPLQLDDNTHPLPVAFIPNVTDAFQTFVIYKFGDFFDQTRFVNLVWNFCDNNDVAVFALTFNRRSISHCLLAESGFIRVLCSSPAVNYSSVWLF